MQTSDDHHHLARARRSTASRSARSGRTKEIKGIAIGEIDPRDPRNAVITDIELAPTNARGKVEYRTTFTHPQAGGHEPKSPGVLFYNIVNRGNHGGPATWHVGGDPGDGFLYKLGHVMLWSGWQGDMPIASVDARPGRHRRAGREEPRRVAGHGPGGRAVRQRRRRQ